MSIISILIVICVVGFLSWLINTYLPMESGIRVVFNLVVITVLVLWLLRVSGLLHRLDHWQP